MAYKSIDSMTEEEIASCFRIKINNTYELEKELRDFSRREAEFVRKATAANKRMNKFAIQLKIMEAEIVTRLQEEAIKNGKPIASSAIGELRKSKVANDKNWQDMSRKLNKARYDAELWGGFLSAWQGRGFRLQELAKITEKSMWGEKVTYTVDKPEFGDFRKQRPEEEKMEEKLDVKGLQI